MDLATAADVADFFAAKGRPQDAMQAYEGILDLNPHIADFRRRYVELGFKINDPIIPLGTMERGQMLLRLMAWDVASPEIEAAYFENLELLLKDRPPRPTPGTLVLGLGSGRSGSTSLAGALAGIENVRATHENPPRMHWPPTPDQIALHIRRFRLLLDRYDLVFDSAHWWLNAAKALNDAFDGMKMIALVRDPDACAASFLRQKGSGRDELNHWLEHKGSFWKPALWDRLYPSYEAQRFGLEAPDKLDPAELAARQHKLVRTYVADYNDALDEMKNWAGDRLLVLATEELSKEATEETIRAFLGIEAVNLKAVLNQGTTWDGDRPELKF